MTDRNVHAHHREVVPPNCQLAATWRRDPLDGRTLFAVLEDMASRRGADHVTAVVRRWLRSRTSPTGHDGPPLGPRGPPATRPERELGLPRRPMPCTRP